MKFKFTFLASVLAVFAYAQTAPAYYSTVDFGKTKNDLKSDLTTLVTKTHSKTISYSELKTLMLTSDVDPNNPANLLLIYGSGTSGMHQRSRSKGGSWNREHVYAKSKGTPNLGTSGPGADGHHLRPADIQLNSTRGSLLFDDGLGPLAYKTSRGGFYPGEEWKGDVARILMYMYIRYEGRAKPLGITLNPSTYSADFPDILIKWNIEDPVSEFEKNRNNVVAQTQGNRNPFIDNPYLATVIWGGPDAINTWPDTFNGGGNPDDTEAPSIPTNLVATASTSSSISLAWTASTDNFAVSGYDIFVNDVYNTTVTTPEATIKGLTANTDYTFYLVAKDASGNKSTSSLVLKAKTEENTVPEPGTGATCGTEDFEAITSTGSTPPASSYTDRTWSNNGIVWTATNARTDKQIYIDGDSNKAINMKKGTLKSSTIAGGIGSFSVKTYLPFSDKDGSYTLKINGEVIGQIPFSKTAKTTVIDNINIEGNIVIELVDDVTSYRVSFDNLSWTCYTKLGTEDLNNAATKLTISPNPVRNSEFIIQGLDKKETVKIYDLNGRLVQSIQQVSNNDKVRLNHLPQGVYIVSTSTQSTKMIVK